MTINLLELALVDDNNEVQLVDSPGDQEVNQNNINLLDELDDTDDDKSAHIDGMYVGNGRDGSY
jgi:hypothetical protein